MLVPYSYIAFEGPLGSDKQILASLVAKALNAELIEDLTNNPFLEDFYKNREGASFQAQLFFLLNRVQILQEVKQPSLFHQCKISNFIIEKDRIYAYQNLTDSELSLYEKLYPMLTADRVRPDLVVYLQMRTDRIVTALRKRKSTKQLNISPEYVDEVVEAYNRFFFHYEEAPCIILNANTVDFEKDRAALGELLRLLEQPHRGVTYYSLQKSKS